MPLQVTVHGQLVQQLVLILDNTAQITYSVGGTPQAEIESSEAGNSTPGDGNGTATTFKVDKKIDVLVTSGTGVNVVPGATSQSITYTVLNEGNSTENFNLVATQVARGDNFDTTSCSVTTPASLPVSLAADASTTVTVQCDIPAASGTVTNGATSIIDLEASINGVTQTVGADTAAGVEVVFADDTGTATDGADRNGSHSATNTYTVNTADIIVAKTSAVISDPSNGTTNPKRIPGATVQYTITVSNAVGASTATGIVISDLVPSTLTITGTTISGGTSTTASAAGQNVTSAAFDLAAGQTATLLITATIN